MRLTIRSIIKWELLRKKPFSRLSYGDEEDVLSLFYVCSPSDNESLSEFKDSLTDESLQQMIKDFERQTLIASQFQSVSDPEPDPSGEQNESSDTDPVYIKDTVSMLVMNGLDVRFALDEMEVYELPSFINALEQRTRQALESSRLWTFLQLSPHLSKKIKSPKDLCPFQWETESERKLTKKELEKGKSMFESFMKSGKQAK